MPPQAKAAEKRKRKRLLAWRGGSEAPWLQVYKETAKRVPLPTILHLHVKRRCGGDGGRWVGGCCVSPFRFLLLVAYPRQSWLAGLGAGGGWRRTGGSTGVSSFSSAGRSSMLRWPLLVLLLLSSAIVVAVPVPVCGFNHWGEGSSAGRHVNLVGLSESIQNGHPRWGFVPSVRALPCPPAAHTAHATHASFHPPLPFSLHGRHHAARLNRRLSPSPHPQSTRSPLPPRTPWTRRPPPAPGKQGGSPWGCPALSV